MVQMESGLGAMAGWRWCVSQHHATSHNIGKWVKSGRESRRGSLYNHPPLDEHRLDTEESEIGQKGIEPKVRVWMRHEAPRFLV